MDDTRRFLRYVTPGLVFLVLVRLYCWILKPNAPWGNLLGGSDSAAQLIAVLAAAGGIGFVIQSLHHALLWQLYEPMPSWWAMFDDQRPLLQTAVTRGLLVVEPTPRRLKSRFVAATLTTVILEMNRTDEKVKKAVHRVDRLWDLLHSVGAGMVASFLAFFAAMACAARADGNSGWWARIAFTLVGGLMFLFALANYKFLVRSTQAVTSAVLLSYLGSRSTRPLTVQCPVDKCWQVKWSRVVLSIANNPAASWRTGLRRLKTICRGVAAPVRSRARRIMGWARTLLAALLKTICCAAGRCIRSCARRITGWARRLLAAIMNGIGHP
jgi:hypothetical protein